MANEEAVSMGAMDAMKAASMPKPTIPAGFEDRDFEVPDLPVEPFTLRDMNSGEELGPFRAEDWVTDTETNITTGHDQEGKVVTLRVLWQRENPPLLACVEDGGSPVTYIVHEIPDNTLPDPEMGVSGPTHREGEF